MDKMEKASPDGGLPWLVPTREEALSKLAARIGEGRKLVGQQYVTRKDLDRLRFAAQNWERHNIALLVFLFSDERIARAYQSREREVYPIPADATKDLIADAKTEIEHGIAVLEGICDEIQEGLYRSASRIPTGGVGEVGAGRLEALKGLVGDATGLVVRRRTTRERVVKLADAHAWGLAVQVELEALYGPDDKRTRDFANRMANLREEDQISEFEHALALLRQAVSYAQQGEDDPMAQVTHNTVLPTGNEVFIVHGHDRGLLLECQSMLKEEFGLRPIVLNDKASLGDTLIEKVERYGEPCRYAVVLFTPDDLVTSGGKEYHQPRPNVLLELGWFWGRLGRKGSTLTIYRGDPTLPSDIAGVVNITLAGNEPLTNRYVEIRRELQEAHVIAS